MNLKKIVVLSGVALLLTGLPALAGKSSVELGKKLFNDPGLSGSTNDKTCNSCHPGGEKLEAAAGKKNLSKIINRCITGPLGGQKIDGRSVEMISLKMYIESLAQK
jgi:cytochrome c peroxidase